MSEHTATRCKICKTPLQSDIEKEYGLCTACLRAGQGTSSAQARFENVKKKVAKIQTTAKDTSVYQNPQPEAKPGIPRVFPTSKGISANIITRSFKISKPLDQALVDQAAKQNMSIPSYLRYLIQSNAQQEER